MLAAGILALAAAGSALAAMGDFHYNYTVEPGVAPFVFPSGGYKQGVWVSDYIRQGRSLQCRWSNATIAFVEFQYGGRGFCISGALPTEAYVRVNPSYAQRGGEVGIPPEAQRVTTDGQKYCLDLDLSFKRVRFFGATLVDKVTFDMVSDLPQGYTADDLHPQTYPMIKEGAPNNNDMFSFSTATPPEAYTRDGIDGAHFKPPAATVSITTPPNAAFFVLNGARAPNMTSLLVATSQALPVNPADSSIYVALRSTQYADVPLLLLPLDPAQKYTLTISGENELPGGTGFNLTSATFYQFDKNAPTTSGASPPGTQTDAPEPAKKKKTNVAAIAGGAAGGAVALILLLVLLFFLCRRRKKPKTKTEQVPSPAPSNTSRDPVDPFMPQHTGQYPDPTPYQFTTGTSTPSAPATSHYTTQPGALVTALPTPSKTNPSAPRYSFSTHPPGSPGVSPGLTPSAHAGSSSGSSRPDLTPNSTTRIVHEQDALDANQGVTRLPPVYNPAWQGNTGAGKQ